MISVRDIFELAKFLNKNRVKSIVDYDSICFASDTCKDFALLLEFGGVTYEGEEHCNPRVYSGWNVFIKKSDEHSYVAGSEYSYKEEWPELKEEGWYITDSARTALMEVISRIRHDSDTAFKLLESRWEDSVVEKQPLKLYKVDVYDTLMDRRWIWAEDFNDAYERARDFENAGELRGRDFVDSDLEITEEEHPEDVLLNFILNDEARDA